MYGLPLSQSDQRIRSIFQSVYNKVNKALTDRDFGPYGIVCSDIQGAWTSHRSVHTPWMLEQIFPHMDLELG